ncbi:UDP-D-apiose/UDP-D-xylose synthase 1-like isoform X2 [Helianthus annuus]|uniref:UDP-D-apiose/UDP-D-xylose synthase 1-like isoform X2 n=1 Tax=Helianthus annuus TaxID=4232 RepID=UPI00165304EA|nr:UDP-D-apiose/UDP-D-xylose synthase 1-like isoform X2 [Helianthus annuus]
MRCNYLAHEVNLYFLNVVKYMGKPSVAFFPKIQDPAYYILKEDTSPCIFCSIEKQRWSYACAKQLIERFIYAEGAENGFENAFIGLYMHLWDWALFCVASLALVILQLKLSMDVAFVLYPFYSFRLSRLCL